MTVPANPPLRPRGLDGGFDERLSALLADIEEHWPVPGGVVAVTDRRGTVRTRPFGLVNRETGGRVTGTELFEIGSISKVATAIVVHQLIDEGRLGLETPLGELLPWFAGSEPGKPAADIRVRQLLQHGAGLVCGVDAVPDETAQALLAAELVIAPGGRRFHYSNLGYILLGLAAAAVCGEPLPALVRSRVLAPLGMTGTTSAVVHEDRPRLAQGYAPAHDDRPWLPGDALAPATWLEVAGADGNIAAPAEDMMRFTRMLLGRGALEKTRVLSARAFERLTATLASGGEDVLELIGCERVDDSRYGLGVNVERHGTHTVLTHGGGMVGYASFLWADVDAGLGVVVLTNANGDSPVAEAIARTVSAWAAGSDRSVRFDPTVWRTSGPDTARPRAIASGMLGTFTAEAPAGGTSVLTIRAGSEPSPGEAIGAAGDGSTLVVGLNGREAPLVWGWGARVATSHPQLRAFHLEFSMGDAVPQWSWGGSVFRRRIDDDQGESLGDSHGGSVLQEAHRAFLGHYRSYTPWFTNFRVVDREGTLMLIAATGVEAPAEDVALVELSPGVFRIGSDAWLPERLRFGPLIDGRAAWAERDGCLYSRAFTA